METLMIHGIRREYFRLPLRDYRLTFDDGLYSQYYYLPLLQDHPAALVFFIATGFVQPGGPRRQFDGHYLPHVKSVDYMYRAMVRGERDFYMTVGEVQELAAHPNVVLGAHSHWHDVILTRTHAGKRKPPSPWKLARFADLPDPGGRGFSIRSRLAFQGYEASGGTIVRRSEAAWEDYIKRDTESCLKWFAEHLGSVPDSYCFPFNEYSDRLIALLQAFGFSRFYAARTTRSDLIRPRTDIDRLVDDSTAP